MVTMVFCAGAIVVFAGEKVEQRVIDAPNGIGCKVWPSRPPADCPFKPSMFFSGIEFTGKHAEYTGADTWYPSWASDGNMYSPWTDGSVYGVKSASYGKEVTTGQAKITGDDPMKLEIMDYAVYRSDASPYAGRYPCGSLVYNGVWYYGTYCLHPSGEVKHGDTSYNWPWLGPFVGFRWSTDYGKTWTETACTPVKPLFGESALKGEPVKMGAPHFVDFGKNMEFSPDGKAYLTAHGASIGPEGRRYAYNSWITGDEIYLIRVTPSVENMNDLSQYEFFAGVDVKDVPVWSKEFSKIKPIAVWKDNMGCVTMTYNAPLKKYFMCVTDGGNTFGYFNTYVLESDRITGPWELVTYMEHFGEQAYFVNIPTKFIGEDGRKMWLCYAANFGDEINGVRLHSKPAGSRYGMCLQEIKLRDAAESMPKAGPLDGDDNVARIATVRASSSHAGSSPEGAVDGTVAGYPGDMSHEWVSQGESASGMLRLNWLDEQLVDRVWLFGRPNRVDQIKAGKLIFSDGTILNTGELPDDAAKGLEVTFAQKKIKWLIFAVEQTKGAAQHIGLSEIAVFGHDARERTGE
jgi:hypothetical protein